MTEVQTTTIPSGWACAIDLYGSVSWHGRLATPEDWAFARTLWFNDKGTADG